MNAAYESEQDFMETSKTQLVTAGATPDARTSAYLADDPRSPKNMDASFDRTPLRMEVNSKPFNQRVSTDSMFFLDHTPNVLQLPNGKQSVFDPRSPTIGLERTPLGQVTIDSLCVEGGNHSNLQMIWEDLDDSCNTSINSRELEASMKTSTPKIVVSTPEGPAVSEKPNVVSKSRTPLSKMQVQSPLAASGKQSIKKAKPVDISITRKPRLSTPTVQKQAQLNRLRRAGHERRASIVEDKENP